MVCRRRIVSSTDPITSPDPTCYILILNFFSKPPPFKIPFPMVSHPIIVQLSHSLTHLIPINQLFIPIFHKIPLSPKTFLSSRPIIFNPLSCRCSQAGLVLFRAQNSSPHSLHYGIHICHSYSLNEFSLIIMRN